MSFVILGHCCKDGSCLEVCPQDCIHPAPGEADFDTVEHLYIDPAACINCSACVAACPAGAIKPEAALTESERDYARQGSAYIDRLPARRARPAGRPEIPVALGHREIPMRVAVVGAGSAAMYTVRELLRRSSSVRITVFEQSPQVGGLLRTAVSPDHQGIRRMTRLFDVPFADSRVETRFGVRVGTEVTIAQLRRRFDAVVLAFGAGRPRGVAAPGTAEVYQAIDLLVSANAAQRAGRPPAGLLAGPTAVIVGGGNVALDIVTSIARRRIVARSGTPLTRLTVVARSPASRPSFTASALHELRQLDVGITVDTAGERVGGDAADPLGGVLAELARGELAPRRSARLSVELIFGREVTAVRPTGRRIHVDTRQAGSGAGARPAGALTADSAIMASGFTCEPLPDVPLGPDGAVCNHRGRVLSPETGEPIEGLYVVGWAKRGGRGGVGENRRCAAQTVATLVADSGPVTRQRSPLL